MLIKSITVTLIAPMSDHAANRGEKQLGNASSIKKRPDDRVYISGQMQRHALFCAIERLNEDAEERGNTIVSNGDGPSTQIATDLRSDLGGFLIPKPTERRVAPITATMAVARHPSNIGRDLLIRLKQNPNADADQNQAYATNEFSQHDEMTMSFHLDVGAVGIKKAFDYDGSERHVQTYYERHILPAEHQRRVYLFLEATRSLTDYANQARNATSGEPRKVLIVLDPKMSRKAARYFVHTDDLKAQIAEQTNILAELKARGAGYFLGDDTKPANDDPTKGDLSLSVDGAYQAAFAFLQKSETTLYFPAHSHPIKPEPVQP